MERNPSRLINGALKHFTSRYELVRVTALRANSILRTGETLLSESETRGHKCTTIALMEIEKGLWRKKQ